MEEDIPTSGTPHISELSIIPNHNNKGNCLDNDKYFISRNLKYLLTRSHINSEPFRVAKETEILAEIKNNVIQGQISYTGADGMLPQMQRKLTIQNEKSLRQLYREK